LAILAEVAVTELETLPEIIAAELEINLEMAVVEIQEMLQKLKNFYKKISLIFICTNNKTTPSLYMISFSIIGLLNIEPLVLGDILPSTFQFFFFRFISCIYIRIFHFSYSSRVSFNYIFF
jgi:hypothetical protein